ncbi:MAG: FMN-binding protein [Rhodospirillales bacterium]|nr:FMN-binding protein [Rhodospirillales bacterium]
MNTLTRLCAVSSLVLAFAPLAIADDDVYQAPAAFIADVFGDDAPDPKVLWITRKLKPRVHEILDHDLGQLRVRYWQVDGRTVWILDETGKTKPITTGVAIKDGRIERLKPLVYRESHGWEVRYPFFTDQFIGLALTDDVRLSGQVDGISGATLSVDALRRLARLALFFDAQVRAAHD